jgi:F420-0:gamma-glutamyl ligase
MHVGNNTTVESSRAFKRTKKVHRVIELIEKQVQKYFVPGKNIAICESTVGIKGRIIFKTSYFKKQ